MWRLYGMGWSRDLLLIILIVIAGTNRRRESPSSSLLAVFLAWGGSSQDKKVNILRLLLNNQSRELSCQKFHLSPAPPPQTNKFWAVWTCIAKNYFSYKSWMGFWFFPENDLFSAQEGPDCAMHGKSVPQKNELREHRKRHLIWPGFIFKAERVT